MIVVANGQNFRCTGIMDGYNDGEIVIEAPLCQNGWLNTVPGMIEALSSGMTFGIELHYSETQANGFLATLARVDLRCGAGERVDARLYVSTLRYVEPTAGHHPAYPSRILTWADVTVEGGRDSRLQATTITELYVSIWGGRRSGSAHSWTGRLSERASTIQLDGARISFNGVQVPEYYGPPVGPDVPVREADGSEIWEDI